MQQVGQYHDKAYKKKCLASVVKYDSRKIMGWGYMSPNGTVKLHFIEVNAIYQKKM